MALDSHVATCPFCRDRLAREAELRSARLAGAEAEFVPPGGIAYTALDSPLGTLWIAAGPNGIVRTSYAVDEMTFCRELAGADGSEPVFAPDALVREAEEFTQYFAGRRRTFSLPIDYGRATGFRRAVLEEVQAIPYGETRSYGEVAALVGHPGAARAVGSVMAGNEVSIIVPCHRVVRADGMPGEYGRSTLGACGVAYKRALLALEREQRTASTA